MNKIVAIALLAGLASLIAPNAASAQYTIVPVGSPQIVSMYAPPPAVGIYLPPTVVATQYPIAPTTFYPIPTPYVSAYSPAATIVAPARVTYGVFGRTYVRTPFYRVRF